MAPTPEQSGLAARTAWEKLLCLLLVCGSLLYYWAVFFRQVLNAGQADDLVDVLWFFEIFSTRENWLDKLAVLILPNHEHVTLFNHLVYLADYALFDKLDFFHYMLLGHVIVLASCMVLAAWLRRYVGWWYALALVFSLFFNLFYWHAGFWAMTALSNQAVMLFALLAAYSAARNPQAIVMPLLWALLAICTQFNGLLVLPALMASRLVATGMLCEPGGRRQLFVWSFAFVVTAAIYIGYENPFAADHLWHYVNYSDPDNLAAYIKPSGQPLKLNVHNLLNIPLTLLAVAGASVFNLVVWVPAVIGGVLLLLALLWVGSRTVNNPDRFWFTMLFFVLASTALVAVGRGLAYGPAIGLFYRYRLYSFLLLVLLAGGLLRVRPSAAWLRIFLFAGLFVQVSSMHVLDDIATERGHVRLSYYYWLTDGGLGRSQMPFYPHNQDLRLFNAYARGYYNPYDALERLNRPAAVAVLAQTVCPVAAEGRPHEPVITAWSKKGRALAVELKTAVAPAAASLDLLFCGDTAAYRITLDQQNVASDGNYAPVLVLKKDFPPAQYRAYWHPAGGEYHYAGDVTFP